jgi:hypothetical protein
MRELTRHYRQFHTDHNAILIEIGKKIKKMSSKAILPWEDMSYDKIARKQLRTIYVEYASLILEKNVLDKFDQICNRITITIIPNLDLKHQISEHLIVFFKMHNNTFKLQIFCNYILQHKKTLELRFFAAYDNFSLFPKPVSVHRPADIKRHLNSVDFTQIHDRINRDSRPSTEWCLLLIPSIRFETFSMAYVLGAKDKYFLKRGVFWGVPNM